MYPHDAEWSSFQTDCFSENLVEILCLYLLAGQFKMITISTVAKKQTTSSTRVQTFIVTITSDDKETNVRSEIFNAMTMKNVVFWDIELLFVPHRRHITSPLQSPAS
jgi:hypothetical protein